MLKYNFLPTFFILLLPLSLLDVVKCSNCTFEGVDLSALDGTWASVSDDGNITYQISLCKPVIANGQSDHSCHGDTSVCMHYKNGTVMSGGNFSTESKSSQGTEKGELWLVMTGDPCLESLGDNMSTLLGLKCGPALGGPKFLDHTYCVNYFLWETDIMCKGDKPAHEVKCYLFDNDGSRYDLSPLAKKKGGYHAMSSDNETEIYINVCRDLVPDGDTTGCPAGFGACTKKKSGATSSMLGAGEVTQPLRIATDKRLTLHYGSSNGAKQDGCIDATTTTINFVCPKRGGSKDPVVESNFNCQYVINWETEYACPEARLTNKTCILTKEAADIDIDLTPLKKSPGSDSPYKIQYDDSDGTTYDVFLNVCEELNMPCPDENHRSNIPACQLKPHDGDFGKSMGSIHEMLLRYADGELTLTYKGGDRCHHNNLQRTTIINFICNRSAENDGKGYPVFSEDDDCIYIFDWETKYACIEHPLGEDCDVSYGGKNYDLSRLVRISGDNWIALKDDDAGSYYINVCHDILPQTGTSGCKPGTAICYKDGDVSKSLGQYASAPVFQLNSNSLQLNYTNGDSCGDGKQISSIINFFCKPGHLDSRPTLVRKSADRCMYEFEWHTAAACPLGRFSGSECKVSDPTQGFSFDLSPLKKTGDFYKITTDPEYDYTLNVCGPVTGTKCDDSDITNPGICQVKKGASSGDYFVTGQYSSELHYFDGRINLTYSGGTPYGNTAHTPRKSEIVFLCDESAGVGQPTFRSELQDAHTYLFEWYTTYACPEQAIECTATDPQTQAEYDLSSLSMPSAQGNWKVEGMNRKTYYINVCRSLNNVPVENGCGPLASVCRTSLENGQEKIDIPDLGQVTSGLKVLGEGRLELTYKSQAMCSENKTRPYITHLQFVCEKSAVVSTPSVPSPDGPCEYTILWNTAAACPLVKDIETELCTVKDPNSDYVFNLQPLIKRDGSHYDVNATDSSFKLNICGNMNEDVCGANASVCYIMKDKSKKVVSYKAGRLEFSETGHMSLLYEGADRLDNGQKLDAIINFECDHNIDLGSPEFLRMERTAYIFTFKTALACAPAAVDCLVQDNAGNEYDLRTLYRTEGWTAYDASKGNTYYINICRAISNMTLAHCPAGPIGGCQVASNGQSYNMGYIQSKPVARQDGTLSLSYKNGDVCHRGTKNEAHRSTRINFFCSTVNAGLMFLTETETCEYVFTWNTPAACPLRRTVGAHCRVAEPLFGSEFNLNPLRKVAEDYHVHYQEYDYILNICGPLNQACGSSSDVAVCQTKPNDDGFTPVDAGKGNATLIYSGGELTLTLLGGKDNCHGSYTRQTVIKFSCDHSTDGRGGPIFIQESFNCQYLFDWPTRYACPPYRTGDCTVKNVSGEVYDLTSLSLTNDNYETTDALQKKRFVINVCRSLVHKKDTTCPYNAAACMIDTNKTNPAEKYHNIGEVNSNEVQIINGQLLLIYNHGEVCAKNQSLRLTTHIHLKCDETAVVSRPTGHFMVGDCAHHFMWSTRAACPIKGTEPVPSTNTSCKVISPKTGALLNLGALRIKNQGLWNVTDGENHLYEFNVCGPVVGSHCQSGSNLMGACQSETDGQKRTYNAGNVASDIYYDDGIIILNYTGGDKCHNDQYERNTIISFVCSPEGHGQPVYIDETLDCTYYIAWHTDLVCEQQTKCTVDVDSQTELDLSPLGNMPYQLVRSSENDELYYVSVCQPLKPIPGTLCPSGAASCLVKPGKKEHLSLGKPRSPKWLPDTREVVLVYTNGSKCEADPQHNYTTRIIFKCRAGPHKGSPVLVSKAGCEYVFQWDTNVVCFEETPTPPQDFCGYKDPQTLAVYNFTVLHKDSPYMVQAPGGKKFLMNICGPADPNSHNSCNKAMVCGDGISYGEPKDYQVVRESKQLKMTYASGEKCESGHVAQSFIQFSCDRSGLGTPQFDYELGCFAVFTWKTSAVCPPVEDKCFTVIDGHLYDLTMLSRDKGSWIVTDSNGNKYWINICASVHGSPCSGDVGVCRQTKDGKSTDSIGRASTATGLKKGKDGTLILEYTEGGPACTETARRSNNPSSKTVINFKCGKTYGGPVFVNRSGDCVFNFNWETKLACEVKKEEVNDVNGLVKDPRSGGVINLNPLMNRSFEFHGRDDSGADTVYQFQLNGNSVYCDNGAVCQQINKKHYRVLGLYTQRKLYIDDDILEIEYNSTEYCKGDQGKRPVSSVIQFHCNKDAPVDSTPELLYSSKDCMYVFSWMTRYACINATVEITPEGGQGPSGHQGAAGGIKPKTVGAIVGVFLAAILICILLVVFHNADRRAAFMTKVRNIVSRRSSEYTQLPSESTNLLDDEEDVLTFNDPSEPDTSREINQEEAPVVTVEPTGYHDDSDEDLLA